MTRRLISASAVAMTLACIGSAHAAPVADALLRPAVAVRAPQRAVLLSAAWAGQRIVAVGERGIVAASDDGGRNWQQLPAPVSVSLTAVRFADARHGVAVGHGGVVLVTSDAGATWAVRLDGRRAALLALEAAQRAGDEAQVKTARQLVADGPDKPFFDVVLFDARRMLVVGAYGLAFLTEDAGGTWTSAADRLDNPKAQHVYAARRAGDTVLLAGEQGLLLRSDDGGRTFRRLVSPYKGSWFTAELPSPAEIVVAGLRGNTWHSGDGGATWTRLEVQLQASVTASTMASDGSLLLASQAGSVLRVRGRDVTRVSSQPLPPLSSLLAATDGSLLALGLGGAVHMTGDAR